MIINMKKSYKQGFTLIELLLIIVIISALAVSVFVALNPAARLADARGSRRQTDVDNILSAIHQYVVDNDGSYPAGMTATNMAEAQIGTDSSGCAISTGPCTAAATACVNLSSELAPYLKSLPIDPAGSPTYTAGKTGYTVQVDANGIVTINSCGSEENDADISASR